MGSVSIANSEVDATSAANQKQGQQLPVLEMTKLQAEIAHNNDKNLMLKRSRSTTGQRNHGDISISRKSSIIEDPMVASAKQRENSSQAKFPITRICLTGGPCAGKTTALTTLSLHLK